MDKVTEWWTHYYTDGWINGQFGWGSLPCDWPAASTAEFMAGWKAGDEARKLRMYGTTPDAEAIEHCELCFQNKTDYCPNCYEDISKTRAACYAVLGYRDDI